MVFGNMGDDSGTGVAFTRDPNTGEKVLFGEYLTNAQGEDVVAGIRTPQTISQMRDGDARGLRRVRAHRRAARAALPRRAGPRVHHRARPAVHAPDALAPSARPPPRCRSPPTWSTRGIITEQEALARIEPAHVDQLLRDQFDPDAQRARRAHRRPQRLAGRGRGQGRLQRRPRLRVGRAGREGHPRPHRDVARRLPRHGRGPGRAHRARRRHVACGGRRAPDRQAVRRRLRGADHRLRHEDARARRTAWASAKGSGSPSTARPARCSSAPCPRSAPASRTRPSSRRCSVGRRRPALRSGPTPTSPRRRPRRAATAPRASACAAPSTCSAKGSGWTSSVTRSSSRSRPRAPRRSAPPARRSTPTTPGGRPVRRGDGQAREAPAGRLRGHLRGHGRAAGRHPADRPAAPRVPAQPRGAARRGHDEAGNGRHDPTEDRELLAAIEALREQNPMLGLRGIRLGLMIPDLIKMQTRAILNAAIARQAGRRRPARRDHDPAGRPRERAGARRAHPRGGGEGGRGSGRRPRSTTSSAR